jgi:hypothetical protein
MIRQYVMSRRRDADRAEAIFKGVGAIILLLLLFGFIQLLPQMLKGKSTGEMIGSMLHVITVFAILMGLVVLVGLIVWVKVRGRK